jgi:hypothetical protein
MKDVGYAVIRDGKKICGVCPIGFEHAKEVRARYAKVNPSATFEVVPVLIGEPVSLLSAPSLKMPA